ncbi:thioesterase family protein [Mangrovimicrobium sediminis]|uniref:Thioesterase family protein n=1 Tax=Mangrovimicrobium sediminis TaxID=2562682 RepID=A0A4Z0LUE3_9GAMM|nr:thioesterase family protein [Haliea sp. SAOS-164]TGD70817.1 thioesterase family protein [Haliea sp. SAOS-164]
MPADSDTHPFDRATHLQSSGDGRYTGLPSAEYANFVGPFGGVTAATLMRAALESPQCQGEPVALTVNFAAPVEDAPFEVSARAARSNRSTQHWMMEMTQAGEVVATATAVFARRRETWSAAEASPPTAPAAGEVPALGWFEGLPVWIRNYEIRTVQGGIDLSGVEGDDSVTTLWLRDQPPRPLDFCSLAALSDAFFPRIFVRRQRLTPIGTVTLTTYFHADAGLLVQQGEQLLLATARASRFRDGYFDQVAELWGVDGELLATTHQLVYYRE